MNAFAFNQVARQPAVDPPQIGEKGDVEDADHPKMRTHKELETRAAARFLRGFIAARSRLQLYAAQPDAYKNQHRYRQHRHHEKCALPAEGIE